MSGSGYPVVIVESGEQLRVVGTALLRPGRYELVRDVGLDEPELARRLHRAADRIGTERYTPPMDALAAAGATFLSESRLTDEHDVPVPFTVANSTALGYGIMLGWLARTESP